MHDFYSDEEVRDVLELSDLRKKIVIANKKLEAYELVRSYAKDVVDYWPNMSFKTIRIMIPKMEALKQALELIKR